MKNYIFLTTEGHTFQPETINVEPDIENLQVIGFAKGENSKKAFKRLVSSNRYLLKTSFDEIFAYELVDSFKENKTYHYLSKLKRC